MKPNWRSLSDEQQIELSVIAPSPGWRLIPGAELPSIFPESFRAKIDSAIIISAPTSTGGTYLVYSANRVDSKDRQVDIEPFGVIVHSSGPGSSGVFLHHGSWEGRSEPPPTEFWDAVIESGIGNYFYSNPPHGLREGTLGQLPGGHRGAFDSVVQQIRERVDGQKE